MPCPPFGALHLTSALQNLKLIFDKNRAKVPKAASNESLTATFLSLMTDEALLHSFIISLYGVRGVLPSAVDGVLFSR